ncbi:TetR/AcrR family transcriptional regulator [Actinoplanes sp. NPDC051851]|uniref:TetR/AcrR family transcriptional regulator n=1 Tax=Actinoplanes sp. NPDC051851 TaxID=3154753 RepID=UPI00341334D8
MPRVSEEYLAGRRAVIVAAAARLFAANGFHATSMADVIRESGSSAGAFYRYFRSKEELITAVSENALAEAEEVIVDLLADGAAPSPAYAVAVLIRAVDDRITRDGTSGADLTRIALQVWAEALRSPELSARAKEVFRRLRGHCAEIARRWQAAEKAEITRRRQSTGDPHPSATPEQIGAAMLGSIQGYVIQHLLADGTEREDYLAGMAVLMNRP